MRRRQLEEMEVVKGCMREAEKFAHSTSTLACLCVVALILTYHNITPCHATSHHAKPHHTTPCHTTPRHTTPHYTTPHHTTPHHTTLHHATPHHATPHHTTPRHTTPRHTKPHHATHPCKHLLPSLATDTSSIMHDCRAHSCNHRIPG